MAKVTDQHLGRVRGKVGDIVLKIRDGKSYVSKAPKKYKKATKIAALGNMDRFKMSVSFAKTVNASDVLRPLWLKSDFKGKTAYSKIFSANHAYSGINHVGIFAQISPSEITMDLKALHLDVSSLNIEFNASIYFPEFFPLPYCAVTILHLSHPKNKKSAFHKFITVEEDIADLNINYGEINQINHSVGSNLFNIFKTYDLAVGYVALISYPADKDPIDTHSHGFVLKGQDIQDKEQSLTNKMIDSREIRKKPSGKSESGVTIRIT